ncbi:unnamed protein product, partial [Owenia fusiformis]
CFYGVVINGSDINSPNRHGPVIHGPSSHGLVIQKPWSYYNGRVVYGCTVSMVLLSTVLVTMVQLSYGPYDVVIYAPSYHGNDYILSQLSIQDPVIHGLNSHDPVFYGYYSIHDPVVFSRSSASSCQWSL